MSGRTAPWQNRPSLIACWEHIATGNGFGTTVASLDLQIDGLITNVVPVCIPRACRLTRYCIIFYYSHFIADPQEITLGIEKSVNCGTSWTSEDTDVFEVPNGGLVANCNCGKLNVLFNRCDLWRPTLAFPVSIVNPIARVNLHFELR